MKSRNGFHLGFGALAAGAALGGALGMLLAPRSGRRTRRAIGYKLQEGVDTVVESAEDLAERCNSAYRWNKSWARKAARSVTNLFR
jgi:gas vesicle protein